MKMLLAIFLTVGSISTLQAQHTPNVVLIVADDLGWNDVGFHGSDIKTPELDKLARESMEYTRFYVSPICSPTRAGLLTGKYPDRFDLRGHVYPPRDMGGVPTKENMLPKLLKDAGYGKAAAFGKWHLGLSDIKYHPNSRGFDYFYGQYNGAIDYFTHKRDGELDWHSNNKPSHDEGYSTDLIAQKAINFLNKPKKDKPFFAYIAFNAPHSPMQAKEKELLKYGYKPNQPNNDYPVGGGKSFDRWAGDNYGMKGRGNTLRQTYAAMVTRMDKAIGDILTSLKNNGLENNTLVWFISDNGADPKYGGDNSPLRGHKFTQWEGGVKVVSLLRWPGNIAPDTKNHQLAAYIDIVPTLLSIAEDNSDINFDGVDITKTFNKKDLPNRYLYLGGNGIVSQKWKFNKGELFRIENDPYEEHNLAIKHDVVVKKLKAKIKKFKEMRPHGKRKFHVKDWKPPKNWTMPSNN